MTILSESVTLTHQLIGFDTRNPGGSEAACIDFLGWLLKNAGFKVTRVAFAENRLNLVARLREAKHPALCFAGHVDTVPLGESSWQFDPFSGEIHNGRLYGIGSSDMKSGIAAMVTAACRMVSRLSDEDDLIVIIVAGEETGCQGSRYLAGRKELLGNAGALVVAEPTSNYPLIGHKGALWLEARFSGMSAHGAMPEKGDNAVYKASAAVERLRNFNFAVKEHPYIGAPTISVGYFHGGRNINSVPDAAEVGIDIRTIPGLSNSKIIATIGDYLGSEAEIESLVDIHPLWTEPELPWVKDVFKIVTPSLGVPPEPKTAAFFTDGAPLQNAYGGIPTLILGPGAPDMAHRTDEYCDVEAIDIATEIYERIAENWYHLGEAGR